MPRTRAKTVRDLRRSNRSRALWELYLNGPLTRQQVGVAAEVSPATVSNLVTDLLGQGSVIEVGAQESNGGRPRSLLQVNPDAGYVIGVDVSETAFLVELFDLGMRVRASHLSSTELATLEPADAADHVAVGVRAVLAESGVPVGQVLGVGVGVPGLVEHGAAGVVHGQSVGWDAVPFGGLLGGRLGLPILLDNGAKTLGRAEQWFGAARGCDDAIILLLGVGVGTCIISNGELYRGATSSAGEWGHTRLVLDGCRCRCGLTGCLEAYVGADALVARYDRLKRRSGTTGLSELPDRIAALLAAPASDKAAARVLAETAGYLGAGIADLVNLFNPERIVLGGWLGLLLADRLLPQIRQAAGAQALRLPFSHVFIGKAELGPDAVALGAATLPIAAALDAGTVAPPSTRAGR